MLQLIIINEYDGLRSISQTLPENDENQQKNFGINKFFRLQFCRVGGNGLNHKYEKPVEGKDHLVDLFALSGFKVQLILARFEILIEMGGRVKDKKKTNQIAGSNLSFGKRFDTGTEDTIQNIAKNYRLPF